jgi:DNA-binding response OmpR family regulator
LREGQQRVIKIKILWIEGRRADSPSFIPSLRKKGYAVEIVPNGDAALGNLTEIDPNLVILNAASMRTNGKRICQNIRKINGNLPILVITSPDRPVSSDICANVILTLPFTSRKLINQIVPLLPGYSQKILHIGPIRLDIERKRVRCHGRVSRLTPRLTQLLRVLMQHPGEVIEREQLFSQVWETGYTGDTRTLDVHISWLRQAIEENPRKPVLLKTIRGVGYRMDI